MKIQFRPMQRRDIGAVIQLCNCEPGLSLKQWEDKRVLGRVAAQGASMVACDGSGRIVGSILSAVGCRGVYWHLIVEKSARKHGIARRLFKLAVNQVIAEGVYQHHTFALPDNRKSIRLIRSLGFKVDARGKCIFFNQKRSKPYRVSKTLKI